MQDGPPLPHTPTLFHVMANPIEDESGRFFTALIKTLSRAGVEQYAAMRYGQCPDYLTSHGLDVVLAPFGRRFDFWTPYALKRAFKKYTPQIVLSWTTEATSLCTQIQGQGVNFIHCAWVNQEENLPLYEDCDHIICTMKPLFQTCLQSGRSENTTHYLPIFVEDVSVDSLKREQYSTPRDAPLLVSAGRLCPEKGFDTLIRAVTNLPHIYVWIMGSGPLRESLENLAIEVGARPRLRFLDENLQRVAFLKTADIVVCPFRKDNLGDLILEAWSQNIPVIAAAQNGASSLIDHDKTGILFAANDDRDLAETLRRLFLNPGLRRDLAGQGYQQYQTTYTPDIVGAKFLSLFQEIARSSPPHSSFQQP